MDNKKFDFKIRMISFHRWISSRFFKYPCHLCEYEATTQSNLKRHFPPSINIFFLLLNGLIRPEMQSNFFHLGDTPSPQAWSSQAPFFRLFI